MGYYTNQLSMVEVVTLTVGNQNRFDVALETAAIAPIHATTIDTIQVNIGLICNLACHHCHVKSGPKRTEQMDWKTLLHVIRAAKLSQATLIDITGGAPEMNPNFKRFIQLARESGFDTMVRTNLTIMLVAGYEDLPTFYRNHDVHLVASLPCYLPVNVDKQRGAHVYEESVEVLQRLNAVGYGSEPDLPLDLVYNPIGPSLPPPQKELEAEYRHELLTRYDIRFTRLITMTNMPIGRFKHGLIQKGQQDTYFKMLVETFNPQTIPDLMCRHQVHVSHDGTLHDCDFNYALGMSTGFGTPIHIRDFDSRTLRKRRIVTDSHCLGCTAGRGSSCGGVLT